jgi:hypothetical protein
MFLTVFGLAFMVTSVGAATGKIPFQAPLFCGLGMGMMVFLHVILIRGSLDEVWMTSTELILRDHGEEDRVPFHNILNVESVYFQNPEKIVLTLRTPCRFGREIMFFPESRTFPFGRHPLAEELLSLIHRTDSDS